MLNNSHTRYGWVSIFLHWLSAVMIIGLFAVGVWMSELDYYDAWYTKAPFLHKSAGVIFFLMVITRLIWRAMSMHPDFESTVTPKERLLATALQYVFYILMVMTPVAGYLVATSKGQPVDVFSWFAVPAILVFDNSKDVISDIHAALAWTIVILAALHTGAALKHHFIDKDKTLVKMFGLAGGKKND